MFHKFPILFLPPNLSQKDLDELVSKTHIEPMADDGDTLTMIIPIEKYSNLPIAIITNP